MCKCVVLQMLMFVKTSLGQVSQFYCDKFESHDILINETSWWNLLHWLKYPKDKANMNIVNLNYLYAAIAEIKVVSLGETIR